MGLKGVAQKGKGISDKGKGKAVAGSCSSGAKRKLEDGGKENSGGGSRRRNDPGVLRFFDDAAADADGSDESDFGNDFMEQEVDTGPKVDSIPGNSYNVPIIPKEEEMDEEEFDKMMEDKYKNGTAFFKYAENEYENKRSMDGIPLKPSEKDPIIWKVKCAVGREKYLVFCLMQKFVDLKSIGTKLQIVSAFAVEHVKGFIFIETDKQSDISEACNGIGGVYAFRVMPVPRNDVSRLFSIRNEYNVVSVGMWARVKNGKYKGDLGQIVAVNNSRKRATVKLIPRIDLQAMTEKFGGGITAKKTSIPAARLISSSELEEFRPLIQTKNDRDTGKVFEVLDGMMIKDGFLFKKISIDSLSCWNVVPSKEELLKFTTSENNESDNMEWLSQLYGERKNRQVNNDGGRRGEKGESSAGPSSTNSFEVHDLVCFGRKDFGVIIGMEKDDSYRILKEGLDSPLVVTVQKRELKSRPSDMKFTALDHRMKSISVNDTVRVKEGPYEGKQGIVKLIYRGIIFLYDQNQEENGGYFCCKSRICEKTKLSIDTFNEKGKESEAVGLDDFFSSSPKSPLSPGKPHQARESNRDSNQAGDDAAFSIGQSLRIRVGPLKGYRCRVIAIRRSDVTVKLESKQKVLTVKSEHLSEVQTKSSVMSVSDDPGSSPFAMLGNEGGAAGASDGWNVGWSSNDRSSWPTTSASGFANFSGSNDEVKTDVEDAWGSKVTPKKNMSWGAEAADNDQAAGWGKSMDSKEKDSSNDASASWEKNNINDNQDHGKPSDDPWDKGKNASNNPASGWDDTTTEKNQLDSWGKGKRGVEGGAWESKSGFGAGKDGLNDMPQQKSWDTGKDKANSDAPAWGNDCQSKDTEWGKRSDGGSEPCGNQDGGWSKKNGWNDHSDTGGSDSNWGKKSNWNSESSGPGGNQDSTWGKKSNWNSESGGASGNEDSTGGKKSNLTSESGGAFGNQDSTWGKKTSWNSESAGTAGNQDSTWGKNSNWNSDSGGAGGNEDSIWGKESISNSESGGAFRNQNSAWGKKSSWNSEFAPKKSNWNSESAGASGNVDSTWGKKSNLNSEPGGASGNQVSAWGKKSWNSESAGKGGNQDSTWGKKSSWNSESGGASGNEDSTWGKKSNLNSESGGASGNQDSAWGKKSGWNSEAAGTDGTRDSSWGKKSDWNSDSGGAGGNEDSVWGKKSNWNPESAGARGNQGSAWGNKSSWNSDSAGTGNNDSTWGKKSSWNSESGGNSRNKGSAWGNKSSWNSESSGTGNNDSSWGKKSSWNSESGGTSGNQDSSWSKKSNWSSVSDNADQKYNWGSKSNWSSGNTWGNQSGEAENDEQTDAFNGKPSGGNWRGGFGGRGGFRSRGGDRGGFGGRSGDRGGFGGGDGDRGGFGGRGGGRGGFRGRGGDRGGFGGRGRSDRGGFGGRGRGRRDQSGGWNNRDSGGNGSWWNKGGEDNAGKTNNSSGGWSTQGSSWSQSASSKDCGSWGKGTDYNFGADHKNEWQGGTAGNAETKNSSGGWSTQGSSWSQSAAGKDGASWGKGPGSSSADGGSLGNKDQATSWKGSNSSTKASAWNAGTDSKTDRGGSWGNNSKSPGTSGGTDWSRSITTDQDGGWKGQNSGSWNKGTGSSTGGDGSWGNKEKSTNWEGPSAEAGGLDKGTGSNTAGGGSWGDNEKAPGGSTNRDDGWKASSSSVKAGSWGNQGSDWNSGGGSGSGGWNSNAKERADGSGSTDQWGKAAEKSWGSGGGKGGW